MVLKTWSEVQKIYKETRTRLYRAARSYWYFWASRVVCFASSLLAGVGMVTGSLSVTLLGCGLFMPTVWLIPFAFRKALTKAFAMDYAAYGLSPDHVPTRWEEIHYPLFLDTLVDQGYSREDVAKLSGLADIIKLPDVPVLHLSQYPGVMFLMGIFVTLFINSITKTPNWEKLAVTVATISPLIIVLGLGFLSYWHVVVNNPKYQHLILQRFLQWAERDIDEAQSLRSQRLRMQLPGSHGR